MILNFDLNPNVTQIYLKFLNDESETRKKLSRAKAPSVSKVEGKMTSFAFLAPWRDNSFESRLLFRVIH